MKLKFLFLVLPLFAVMVVGCTPQAVQMEITTPQLGAAMGGATSLTSENAAITQMITEMIKDQGVLDNFMARARAHGLNPGLKLTTGFESYMKIGLDGIDADVSAEVQGDGTALPSGTRASLIDVLNGLEGRTDPQAIALRDQIILILGWNRTAEGGNPDSGGG